MQSRRSSASQQEFGSYRDLVPLSSCFQSIIRRLGARFFGDCNTTRLFLRLTPEGSLPTLMDIAAKKRLQSVSPSVCGEQHSRYRDSQINNTPGDRSVVFLLKICTLVALVGRNKRLAGERFLLWALRRDCREKLSSRPRGGTRGLPGEVNALRGNKKRRKGKH